MKVDEYNSSLGLVGILALLDIKKEQEVEYQIHDDISQLSRHLDKLAELRRRIQYI